MFDQFGPSSVLQYRDLPDPEPIPGHALVRTRAIGLNFADVYRRKGTYHLAGVPPYIAGYEAAGEIVALGSEISGFAVGDRVGFADAPFANAELVLVPFEKLIPLPEAIGFETAAAVLLQGLTAQYLIRDSHDLKAGETVLVHAAAGGVGLLLVQMAKARGARVLGLTSSPDKAQVALEAGAHEVALYSQDWVSVAKEFSEYGMDVAFDSVGSTLMQSFESVRPGGHVVFYGMAGGDPPLIDPRMLMDTSKRLTGGDLWNVLTTAERRRTLARELFQSILLGELSVRISGMYPLSEGAKAHDQLESRQSTGKILLIP
ncbi:quinone oxidoreductase family protein [Deinococcus cellulosilyticus]|uniref:Alcohol dehydrogenase n=1 Tax=Deinococcus cellulosilyticus (strain DSM 18568 / NBRC 106333 / KACC 11606 / 5516J-15) TaxID=1223518 RepID=A0A511MWK1_DEIC1|nr:quinone oxidoreductase [Deinococcus cellulosilyticus]GEM44648.1 alcohol dehydrogenase [Deinococcus cellulosilyticus NBRC 106333 = KACC 11606]